MEDKLAVESGSKTLYILVDCNARTTYTNSSGVKPDLGLDQDQQ